jgi:hypothetical protein
MVLLAALLALAPALPATASSRKSVVVSVGAAALPGAPSAPALPGVAAPALAPQLPYAGADLRYDPEVQRAMANPVPATAIGLKAAYFQPLPGAAAPVAADLSAQPRAARAGEAAGSALESTRLVADALGEKAAPGAAASVSNSVFDGLLGRAELSAAGPVSAAGSGRGAPPRGRSSSETDGLSGRALLEKLHDITGRGFREHDYGQAQDFLFGTADQVVVNGVPGVIDAYSGVFRPGRGTEGGDYPENGDQNGDGHVDREGMNVEHVWPQSFFDKRAPMKSDIHHLMATFVYPNGIRGHLPFGEVRRGGDYSNSAGAKRGQGVFEPPDFSKGRAARMLLYFYARYYDRNISNGAFGDDFWNDKLPLLLRWNRQFPPTDWERRRNDKAEAWQGNRNPFVDDPSLADRIGAEGFARRPRVAFEDRQRVRRRRGR